MVADCPRELSDIIHKTLAKEPPQRWSTAEDFAEALSPWHATRSKRALSTVSAASVEPGTHFDRYKIMKSLGNGPVGYRYEAEHQGLGQAFLLEVLDQLPEENTRRFLELGRVLASFHHPVVLSPRDLGRDHGLPYLVTELPPERTLAGELSAGPLKRLRALRLAREIGEALHAAGQKGIGHGSVHPEEVHLTPEGSAQLAALGYGSLLAVLDQQLTMAPQQPHYVSDLTSAKVHSLLPTCRQAPGSSS